jgi:hypothetical protein
MDYLLRFVNTSTAPTQRLFIVNIRYNVRQRILNVDTCTRKYPAKGTAGKFEGCSLVLQFFQINNIFTREQISKKRLLAMTAAATCSFRRNTS